MTYRGDVSLISPLADLGDVLATNSVAGIDASTRRYATTVILPTGFAPVAEVDGALVGDGYRTILADLPDGDREDFRYWASLPGFFERYFSAIFLAYGKPVWTILEQPFKRPVGNKGSIHPASWYALTCGMVGLANALGEQGVMEHHGPSEWKVPGLGQGFGDAKKGYVLWWATHEMGLPVECKKCGQGAPEKKTDCSRLDPAHDAADSLGIAVAAGRRWAGFQSDHAAVPF